MSTEVIVAPPALPAKTARRAFGFGRFVIERFDPQTEARYLSEMTAFYAPILRAAVTVAIVFYFAYLGSDWLLFGRYRDTGIPFLMLGIAGPAAALGIAITYARVSDRAIRAGVFAATLINALVQVLAYDLGFRHGQPIPYEGLISIIYYSYFMLGMEFRWATLQGILIIVTHIGLSYFSAGMPIPMLFDHAAEMSGSLLIGALAAALLENFSRRSWINDNRLRELVERDPLTGLYNQRSFIDQADARIAASRVDNPALTVMVLTIEHLPLYNRQLSHPAVDQCMRELAAALNRELERLPSTEGLVGWLGGEYFALLISPCSARQAAAFSEQLSTRLSALAIRHPGTASGIAEPIGGWYAARAQELGSIRNAMQAAYESLLRNPRWRLRRVS